MELTLTEDKEYTNFKNLVDKYLSMHVRNTYGNKFPVTNEYTVTVNMISKKLIVARIFSDLIVENRALYSRLDSLISSINKGFISQQDMTNELQTETTDL